MSHDHDTRREEALGRLEKIARMVPGVVYQYRLRPDGSSSFPFSSAGIEQVYRVTPDEVRDDASKVFTRLHPDDFAQVVASIQASARDLSPWRDEYRVRFDDGSVRWLQGHAMPEREPDGSTLWHGFITDITERKEAERALRQSQERFNLAMDATSDGLWDLDVPTGVGSFSPAYFGMLGYAAHSFEELGVSWAELVHPDDRPRAVSVNLDCIEGRVERFEVEFRMRAKDGEWRWILGRGQAVGRDANGRALRLLGTHVDITERKKLQAQLAQQDRLATMGILAASVAHEINNPLSYVLSNLEALVEELPRLAGVDPAVLTDLLDCARNGLEGSRRIQGISRSLGTFSRVDRTEREGVDLNTVIEMATAMAHNEVKFRATLVKQLAPVPLVLASDGKLAQVFLNLVINAAHAIDEGKAQQNTITVRTWARGGDVFGEVADTGHGIARENLERVFDPFFTTKKVGQGSGLGLTISRNIVTEFGGDITVESEVGKGTRVVVRLPAAPAAAVKANVMLPGRREASAVRGRVLVVDDEEPIRRVLKRVLSSEHDVVCVASGREGRALLEHDAAFDLVLCDVMMADVTGIDLHVWLSQTNPVLASRLVFISGGAFTPHTSEYLASVSNPTVDKPFDPRALLALAAERVRQVRTGAARPGEKV